MPDGGEGGAVERAGAVGRIAAADWEGLHDSANPFLAHSFLACLEESGSVGGESGWHPCPILLRDAGGKATGAAPLYLKEHSYGEYVFDHGWARAFNQAGGQYYPKLQLAVPFTPVPGPRLLVGDGSDPDAARRRRSELVAALLAIAQETEVSSLHATFLLPEDAAAFAEAGFLLRNGYQYHWRNRDYGCFADFLSELASRKRKSIIKERAQVAASGVKLHRLTGAAIGPHHWDAFYRGYIATGQQKWGSPYLTRDFFHRLGETMAERLLLVMAEREGVWIAGALNLIGRDRLYGRNWGAIADLPFLHFETCYYQAIEFAIERKLAWVEAGAQGEHKIQRGYLPVATTSAHWIRHPGLARAVEDFLRHERAAIDAEMAALAEFSPFRKEGAAD